MALVVAFGKGGEAVAVVIVMTLLEKPNLGTKIIPSPLETKLETENVN